MLCSGGFAFLCTQTLFNPGEEVIQVVHGGNRSHEGQVSRIEISPRRFMTFYGVRHIRTHHARVCQRARPYAEKDFSRVLECLPMHRPHRRKRCPIPYDRPRPLRTDILLPPEFQNVFIAAYLSSSGYPWHLLGLTYTYTMRRRQRERIYSHECRGVK